MDEPVVNCPVCGAGAVDVSTVDQPGPVFICTGDVCHEFRLVEESADEEEPPLHRRLLKRFIGR